MPGADESIQVTPASAGLEVEIGLAGELLMTSFGALVQSISDQPLGPQALATRLGIDKVLASRLLKAIRSADPIAAVHRMPGPDPLRRVVQAMSRQQGVRQNLLDDANKAVNRFDRLIRVEIGDRSSLDTIISAWAPDARREFELRRKQAAFRALSQLKGLEARAILASVFLHPDTTGHRVDIVWINGLFGLHRLRPGVTAKFATRRMAQGESDRRPRTLDGKPVEDPQSVQLPEFCSRPTPQLDVRRLGEVVQYALPDRGFGPATAVDLVLAEANLSEIARFARPGVSRKSYVFAEISTPAKALQFDAFVHEDLFRSSAPSLHIFDTAFEGVADVNNPVRQADKLDMLESIESLGGGVERARSSEVPRYSALLNEVCARMRWDGRTFRAHRCRIEYPVYGTQVVMAFDQPQADSSD